MTMGGAGSRIRVRGILVSVADSFLIVERGPHDRRLWHYGLASADGQIPPDAYRLQSDRSGPSAEAVSTEGMLWVTAILRVRRAGKQDRIVYNLSPA
jgi:hypothetical protein